MNHAGLLENSKNKSLQHNRTVWSSVEIFAACFVANAPAVYTLLWTRRHHHCPSNSANRLSGLPAPDSQYGSKRASRFWLQKSKEPGTITDTYQMAKVGARIPRDTSNEEFTFTSNSNDQELDIHRCNLVVKV